MQRDPIIDQKRYDPCYRDPERVKSGDMWARVKTLWPLFLSYLKPYRYFLLAIVLHGNCLILLELSTLSLFCVLVIVLQGKQIAPLSYKF